MKVLVSDSLSPKGIEILEQEPGIEVDVNTRLSPGELIACIGQYDALLIRSGTKVTEEVLAAADNLKVVGRAGVGVDNVDIAAASRKGVVVMNTPGGNTITTAEHTLSLLTSLSRHIPVADNSLRQGKWDRKSFKGVELVDKVLGIIGLGRIGKEIAVRAQGMGMRVIAFDPMISQEEAQKLGVEIFDLSEIYPQADFITVHTPLTDQTRHLINKQTIGLMKKGVYLINCARGGIIDEQALAEAIQSGHVAGAALDVFEQEPPSADNPLIGLKEVVCTPHLGASTAEAQEKVALDVVKQVVSYLKNGIIVNAVNVPSLSPETQALLDPYIELGKKLGRLMGQLVNAAGNIEQFAIALEGNQLLEYADSLNNHILAGVLEYLCPECRVNRINAQTLAGEKGIKILPPRQIEGDYANMILVELIADGKLRCAAATLLSNKSPRIIMLDGFKVEFAPSGYILILFNQDKPGIIGNIGTALGKENINIADMQFGRRTAKNEAISIFRIDSAVPEELLPQLAHLPHIHTAQQVYL